MGAASASAVATAAPAMPVIAGHRCTKVTRLPNVTLRGTAGNDVLCGLGGHDTLIGGRGNDILIGRGPGDTASFADHTTGVVASLVTHVASDRALHQNVRLIGIANLVGGRANDVLAGNAGANVLVGGPGNDELTGAAGNDSLLGGAGNDWLIGGAGTDQLRAGSGNDTIDGSGGFGDTIDCGTDSPILNVEPSANDVLAPDCEGDTDQVLQRYHGTVSALDTDANTITVQWTEVNDSAQTWLDANGDPNPVVISLAGAAVDTLTGGSIQPGDQVEVEATTSLDGTSLDAVTVHAAPNLEDTQFYLGLVERGRRRREHDLGAVVRGLRCRADVARRARRPEPRLDLTGRSQRSDVVGRADLGGRPRRGRGRESRRRWTDRRQRILREPRRAVLITGAVRHARDQRGVAVQLAVGMMVLVVAYAPVPRLFRAAMRKV